MIIKNKKKIISISISTLCMILAIVVSIYLIQNKLKTKKASSDTTNSIEMNINTDDSDENIDWTKYQTTDYNLSESLEITKGGIYNLTGSISNGLIKINTSDNVKLVLSNVDITNNSGPAIFVEKAKNVVIELKEGTTNYVTDGTEYSGYDEDVNGAIYSKADITFEGTGTLEVKANYQDGIVGKDDLKIADGTYKITSADDGIRGKDSVYIKNGTFEIVSQGDGIKSTNSTDTGKGFVLIENGNITITANLDGIQAETNLMIKNGNFNIKTGGGSANSSHTNNETNNNWGKWQTSNASTETNDSAKGIKAGNNLIIDSGEFTLNTSDDSIHSNNYISINNGNISASSGDDGVHADTELIINGGNLKINKSYEGIESAKITINDGNINIVSTDDGINVAGGSDSSSMNRPGQNNYTSNTNNILTINAGEIMVNAEGDGIDVNGSGYVYGGNITVNGPTNGGNAFLDYDGEFIINGGTFYGVGASGMTQGASSNSTQNNVLVNFTSTYNAGTNIKIKDSSGNVIEEFNSEKSFSSMLISSSKLEKGKEYTILMNDQTYQSFTVNGVATTVGNSSNNMPGDMPSGNNRGKFGNNGRNMPPNR